MTPSLVFSAFLVGCGAVMGAALYFLFYRQKLGSFKHLSKQIIHQGELEADRLRKNGELDLKQKQLEQQHFFERTRLEERSQLLKEEERIKQREDKLEERMNLVDRKLSQIEKREAALTIRKEQVEQEKKETTLQQEKLIKELENLSGLSQADAKDALFKKLTDEVNAEVAHFIRRARKEAEEEAEKETRKILATAINRLAVPCVSEATVNTVSIPNEEMKGRIIGKEGRNIRTLERLTGVNFLIDDTPNAVVISGFDPTRLYLAKTALTALIMDGRIHPTSIEEAVSRAEQSVKRKIQEYGEDAAWRTGQNTLDPELIRLLGSLKFRYSYGQNVLDHSLEVSHLMGMIAAELRLDVALAKRIGLLHDIGKAVSHEVEGTHALIGYNLALRYGESKEVANGIGCHHNEIEPITIEASFCGAADAISASRPGARIEAVEEYIKRLQKLEELAFEFPGIEKAYAMQAGKEIVISVLPEIIDDTGVQKLARDLTKKIEKELRYSGRIKVSVIREKRAVEYAV